MPRAEETKFPGISGAGLVMRGSPKTWPPATPGHHPEQLRYAQATVPVLTSLLGNAEGAEQTSEVAT